MNKKLALIAAIGALGAFAAQAYDGKVSSAPGPHPLTVGLGSGGAFLFSLDQQNSGPTVKTGYDVPGSGYPLAGQFLAFCVETGEFFDANQTYDFTVNSAAVEGGVGGSDPISAATAWLFKKFINGTLTDVVGFAYNDTGGTELQHAIWALEGESNNGSGSYLVTAAQTAAGSGNNTDPTVAVLNLYQNGARKQDMLVVVPEPSTYIAGGLALLPLLFGLRTRFAKK